MTYFVREIRCPKRGCREPASHAVVDDLPYVCGDNEGWPDMRCWRHATELALRRNRRAEARRRELDEDPGFKLDPAMTEIALRSIFDGPILLDRLYSAGG